MYGNVCRGSSRVSAVQVQPGAGWSHVPRRAPLGRPHPVRRAVPPAAPSLLRPPEPQHAAIFSILIVDVSLRASSENGDHGRYGRGDHAGYAGDVWGQGGYENMSTCLATLPGFALLRVSLGSFLGIKDTNE